MDRPCVKSDLSVTSRAQYRQTKERVRSPFLSETTSIVNGKITNMQIKPTTIVKIWCEAQAVIGDSAAAASSAGGTLGSEPKLKCGNVTGPTDALGSLL